MYAFVFNYFFAYKEQHKLLLSRIQTSKTGDQLYSDTSHNGECFMIQHLFHNFVCWMLNFKNYATTDPAKCNVKLSVNCSEDTLLVQYVHILKQRFATHDSFVHISVILFNEKHCTAGPWCCSSGQHARLILRRSEFESRWRLVFILSNLCWKRMKINRRRSCLGRLKNITRHALYVAMFYLGTKVGMEICNLKMVLWFSCGIITLERESRSVQFR